MTLNHWYKISLKEPEIFIKSIFALIHFRWTRWKPLPANKNDYDGIPLRVVKTGFSMSRLNQDFAKLCLEGASIFVISGHSCCICCMLHLFPDVAAICVTLHFKLTWITDWFTIIVDEMRRNGVRILVMVLEVNHIHQFSLVKDHNKRSFIFRTYLMFNVLCLFMWK